MVRRIVVPLDGSQLSHAALPVARGLAERTGASVTLVSVIDPPRDFYITARDASSSRWKPADIERLASEEKRLQEYLDGVATTFENMRVATEVRLGQAAEEILEAAEASPQTIIIMASHGRTGLGRMLIGSVANRVIQASNMPVIVVKASEDSKAEYGKRSIARVMVPLDGSRFAEQALEKARSVFGNDVRYVLIRIVEPVAPGQAYTSEVIADYERQAHDAAEDYLEDVAGRLKAEGATVARDVRIIQPSLGITQFAEETSADLIAISTHGRSGMGRFLMGSVAERVLHNAERPVMMVKAREE